jgi:hypothetical protein
MSKLHLDSSWKKTFLGLGIGLLSLAVFSFFPTTNFLENLTKSLVFLLLIPYLFVRIVLKENLSDFGMKFKLEKEGFIGSFLLVAIGMLVIYPLANYTSFPLFYRLSPTISGNFLMFVFYELVLVNLLLLFQEYFFKGFIISICREKFSKLSIIIQAAIYLIPLAFVSASLWNIIPMAIISIFGGILAYRTKTFFYSYLGSLLFLIVLDSYLIFLSQKSL